MAIELLFNVLQMLTGSQFVADKAQRNEYVVRLLQQVGLDPEHPPADFEGVYAYALVKYGVGKPKVCLELFRSQAVRQGFRLCFERDDAQGWLNLKPEVAIVQGLQTAGCDLKQELGEFAQAFLQETRRSRTPKETLMGHQLRKIEQSIEQKFEQVAGQLGAMAAHPLLPAAQTCQAAELAGQMRRWFEVLGYRLEKSEKWETPWFEWVINIPKRRGFDRVLVRGMVGEVGVKDVMALRESVGAARVDEGWVVTARRISKAARSLCEEPDNEDLFCFTFDEFLDQDADFEGYLTGLAAEIDRRGIEAKYVPLACTKEEVDAVTHQRLGMSRYGEDDGWTEGYIDLWLDDPVKEHLSILGEFGTGKTWLTLHYAAGALRKYQAAKAAGGERPRLPIVIPLRDYAKAVSVESLFSEFFFRKHEIPIPGYSAFEELNRMGKLLLIFDGFDEMAARVDKQQMINNFWELAKVVVPGSKVILTCRTEHFPEAREGRALLNAELQASTRGLSGETPQFEVLELEKFEDAQIRELLRLSASEAAVEQVMGNAQLMDLARRPVMTELILEALPDIEVGKPVDMSRIYLYAVRRKMERDIKAERTFTSMADKLYFLCELSWEMLSNDRMSLNYREFPDRIRKLFGAAVQEEKDLDHWHFDMMGQTMLIRNAEGDYTPAHRSLLEFFVAFKFAAELGALAPDFLELAQMKSGIDYALDPREYSWSEYFGGGAIAPLLGFRTESLEGLRSGFGKTLLTKIVIDLIQPMVETHALLSIIRQTANHSKDIVNYLGGNALTLVVKLDPDAISDQDLSHTSLAYADLTNCKLRGTNFSGANLQNVLFSKNLGGVVSLAYSGDGKLLATGDTDGYINLWNIEIGEIRLTFPTQVGWVYAIAFSPDNQWLASGSHDKTVRIWEVATGECYHCFGEHVDSVWAVAFSPDGKYLASGSNDCTINIFDLQNRVWIRTLKGHTSCVKAIAISPDGKTLISSGSDTTIRHWDWSTGVCTKIYTGHSQRVNSVDFHPNGTLFASCSFDHQVRIWNMDTGDCRHILMGHIDRVRSVRFSPDGSILASCGQDNMIRLWDSKTGACLHTLMGHSNGIWALAFSPDQTTFVSGGADHTIRLWSFYGECLKIWQGRTNTTRSAAFSPDGRFLAFGQDNQLTQIWNLATGDCSNTLTRLDVLSPQIGQVWTVSFSPNSQILATGIASIVKLWHLKAKACVQILEGHTHSVFATTFSPDGTLIATGSDDRTIKIWSKSTGDCLHTLRGHTDAIWSVSFSPNGKFLASGSCDQTIKMWNIQTDHCVRTLLGHGHSIWIIVFSPDGFMLASGGRDATIKLWNLETGDCLQTFEGHELSIWTLAFSPDGKYLASGSDDRTVKLWNIQTGRCLQTFNHKDQLLTVRFNSEGTYLITACKDQTNWTWDIRNQSLYQFRSNRPYEGMNITGVKGLSESTIASLKALGAIEDGEVSETVE
jgi:WD40 repeat protein